ncbi:class I SAM-dependent RNA methyltransferase [Paracoccus aerodenitrificans]|uniref:class I SAM-dependent RNA methyltransferase n=1 Tax=Paracoccus aerodenitrificans TaxID=3017781 RepID=UPI0022F034FB|nr:class I SAM-dependent RNA methyltransferase [Paracoccus aerodenitrificans]WBU63944.1 class I SAM-dependent RNA methyltransferase [Paracoccus aerodenitrificans]
MTLWTVERLGRHGDGIAVADDGQQVFAARTLPGEQITGEAHDGRIAAPKILRPSPDRIRPDCPHYASCGGCALMHAADGFVAQWKADLVRSALSAHGITARIAGVATSPERSRRRAVLSGRRTKRGATVGFHGRASDQIVDVTDCRVLRPQINAALPLLRDMVAAGASRNAELSLTVTETPAGLDIAVSGGKPIDAALTETLGTLMRQGELARLDWDGTPMTRRAPARPMGRARVVPPPGAFLQATAEGEAALLSVVRKTLEGRRRIVDLFAGCGTFTLPLAAQAEMHAVEGLAAPLEALDAAWRSTPDLHRITTETRDLATRPLMPDELARFDAAVIDPPRSGAAAQARELAASSLDRIAWVSCDPVTFARDAATMTAAGWRMGGIYVVDQFRWSPHVETVTSFTRD